MKKYFSLLLVGFSMFLSAQIVQLIDSKTKESVSYTVIPALPSGAKLDGVLYARKGSTIYKRVISDNIVNVAWWGSDGDAIQKAIDGTAENRGGVNYMPYEILIPSGFWVVNSTIKLKNINNLRLRGSSGTFVVPADGSHLDSIFELDGVSSSSFEDIIFTGNGTGDVRSVLLVKWSGGIVPSSFNYFKNLRIWRELKFVNGFETYGNNQVDTSVFVNCKVSGDWTPSENTWWKRGFYANSPVTGNQLVMQYQHCYADNLENAWYIKNVGGDIVGGGAGDCGSVFTRDGVNETMRVDGFRVETSKVLYQQINQNASPDNISLNNIWFSGIADHKIWNGSADDGVIIKHFGGTLTISNSIFYQPKTGTRFQFWIGGGMGDKVCQLILRDTNIESDFLDLFNNTNGTPTVISGYNVAQINPDLTLKRVFKNFHLNHNGAVSPEINLVGGVVTITP